MLVTVDWGGYVSESHMPFILLVGVFRPEQVTEILDGFLNTVMLAKATPCLSKLTRRHIFRKTLSLI